MRTAGRVVRPLSPNAGSVTPLRLWVAVLVDRRVDDSPGKLSNVGLTGSVNRNKSTHADRTELVERLEPSDQLTRSVASSL